MSTHIEDTKDTNLGDSISIEKDVYQHTDSVEAIILEASNRLARFEYEPAKWHNMMVYEASDLEGFLDWLRATLQAQTSQQVENWHKESFDRGLELGQQQVEEAVRKERERIEEQVLTPLYEKIDKWFQEKHDIIGQGALAAVFEEALQAITPNHQD